MDPKKFPLKLRFSSDPRKKVELDLYDGAFSFYGFAQAIQIAVHAYTTGEVISRAPALKGATLGFSTPRRGSVIFDIIAVIERYPAMTTLGAPAFYDFMKYTLSRAAGYLHVEPETLAVRKTAENEPFFDQLSETLEGSLQRAHRAIDNGIPSVTLERPRSPLLEFNRETSQWVNTRDENPDVEEFSGNITRYNAITGNGRAYIREFSKVLPFRPGVQFPDNKRGLLSWSLHGNTVSTTKELKFTGSRIESAKGDPKRLILVDTVQA